MNKSKKGVILEWFVEGILRNSGFGKIKEDNLITYKKGNDFMVQGLGQVHQIDVLMAPPIQLPFYSPSRIAVECKCYSKKINLQIARSLLGLREDLNNFDIITKDILNGRRNNHRKLLVSQENKFLYSVVLASVNGLTKHAEEFLITHKIPYISLTGPNFDFLHRFLEEVDLNNNQLLDFLKMREYETYPNNFGDSCNQFLKQSKELFKKSFVGVSNNGDFLFLINNKIERGIYPNQLEYQSMIHWQEESKENWTIKLDELNLDLSFNLPFNILDNWKTLGYDKVEALNIKTQKFSKISVFKLDCFMLKFFIINLDLNRIESYRQILENNQDDN